MVIKENQSQINMQTNAWKNMFENANANITFSFSYLEHLKEFMMQISMYATVQNVIGW